MPRPRRKVAESVVNRIVQESSEEVNNEEAPTLKAVEDAAKREEVVLSEPEVTLLEAVKTKQKDAKQILAEIQLRKRALQQEEDRQFEIVDELDKRFTDQIVDLASAHDIDVDDPSKGRWTFDTDRFIPIEE